MSSRVTWIQFAVSPHEAVLSFRLKKSDAHTVVDVGDGGGHLPECSGFPNLVGFLGGGCLSSQCYHLSHRHPGRVTCALPAVIIWLHFCDNRFLLSKRRGLRTCTWPERSLCQHPTLYPHDSGGPGIWVEIFFFLKGTNLPFFPLESQGGTTDRCPFAHLSLMCYFPKPGC